MRTPPTRRAAPQPAPSTPPTVRRLVRPLLDWFDRHARDLPWRRTRDPYAIWVSEIMLQQTQVKTVIPYWDRWMREFPTVQALAAAGSDEIHKAWEGLGYYTRVRNMQKAAQQLCAEHQGVFPRVFEEVLDLPGIGRYTAGAICSIAFNQPTPILDGNVVRVLTRLFGITEDPHEKATNTRLWDLAARLVKEAGAQPAAPGRPGNCSSLNQSLMELGALVCTPRQPGCGHCPVRSHCVAERTGRVEAIPNLGERVRSAPRRFVAFVAEEGGRYLVRQRPAGMVNAHLWEFPNAEVSENHTDLREAARLTLGPARAVWRPLCTIKHSITRYRITLEAFEGRLHRRPARPGASARWLALDELKQLAFTSAHRKILGHLAARRNRSRGATCL